MYEAPIPERQVWVLSPHLNVLGAECIGCLLNECAILYNFTGGQESISS